jgi:hypothetical protein
MFLMSSEFKWHAMAAQLLLTEAEEAEEVVEDTIANVEDVAGKTEEFWIFLQIIEPF